MIFLVGQVVLQASQISCTLLLNVFEDLHTIVLCSYYSPLYSSQNVVLRMY